jgi:hypothetical protein
MGQTLVLAGQTITPGVLNRIYGTADAVPHTVNNTSYAQLSSIYTIPASDPNPGTAYRIYTFGNGAWGTAMTLQVSLGLADVEIGTAPTIAGAALSNAALFDFEIWGKLICVGNGTSGTWVASLHGVFTETANAINPGTAADNSVTMSGCTHASVVQDTTVANDFGIYAKWGGTTGSPTFSCLGTIFEKVN